MCNISFCDVDSKVDLFFQPTLYIIVIVLGLPANCMALWAAYMQVRRAHTQAHMAIHASASQSIPHVWDTENMEYVEQIRINIYLVPINVPLFLQINQSNQSVFSSAMLVQYVLCGIWNKKSIVYEYIVQI